LDRPHGPCCEGVRTLAERPNQMPWGGFQSIANGVDLQLSLDLVRRRNENSP
jgi:hypothetical protein